jgi:hypothetical protein
MCQKSKVLKAKVQMVFFPHQQPTTNNQQPENLQPIILHRTPVFVKHITQTNE